MKRYALSLRTGRTVEVTEAAWLTLPETEGQATATRNNYIKVADNGKRIENSGCVRDYRLVGITSVPDDKPARDTFLQNQFCCQVP